MGRRRNFHTTGIFSYLVKSHKNLVQCFVKAKQIIIILLRITICKVTNNITNISDVTLLIRASESKTLCSKIEKMCNILLGNILSEINNFLFENYFKTEVSQFWGTIVVLIQWPRKLPEHTVCATSSTDVGRGRSPLCNISHWHMIDDWQRCRML